MTLVERLNDIWSNDDHARGCRGREYECTCGFDDRTFATAKEAAEAIEMHEAGYQQHLRIIAELKQENLRLVEALATARADAIEEAAKLIEEGFKRPGITRKMDTCDHGKSGWDDCEMCAAAAIRTLFQKKEG